MKQYYFRAAVMFLLTGFTFTYYAGISWSVNALAISWICIYFCTK